jgi:hypothetical protein
MTHSFDDKENNKIVESGVLTQKNAMSLNTRANNIFVATKLAFAESRSTRF